jgi:integrase
VASGQPLAVLSQNLWAISMRTSSFKLADPTKILTRAELAAVLADLRRKAPRSKNTHLNLVIFRLAACCGLRASEIAQLQVGDVRTEVARPHIHIRVGASKGGKSRTVPLWWDAGTLANLGEWGKWRIDCDAAADQPLVASLRKGQSATSLSRHTLRKRFRTACKILGAERLQSLTIHHGRHTFISHALAGGRTLAEVRDAVGHGNISITSQYIHSGLDTNSTIGNLFEIA